MAHTIYQNFVLANQIEDLYMCSEWEQVDPLCYRHRYGYISLPFSSYIYTFVS